MVTRSSVLKCLYWVDMATPYIRCCTCSLRPPTLKLTGQGQVLDLTLLGHKVESIEVIDLTGTGNNTLKLSLTDVLEQGGTSLFTNDGHMQMMVKGNAGDAVILDDLLANGTDPGNWANSGQVNVSGVVYEVYRHDTLDAELLVQQGVTTTLV